jgi:hypothetical protein
MLRNIIYLWLLCFALQVAAQDLPKSHAHNDYEKLGRKSLYAALTAGFRSIEIDVFVFGKTDKNTYTPKSLRIAHIRLLLGLRPNLEERYFARARQWLATNPRDSSAPPIILMLDLKNRSEEAYYQIRHLCQKYEDILCVYYPKTGEYKRGAVQILLSGSKPVAALQRDTVQYMWLDMGLGTIGDKNVPPQLAPRVSSSYGGNFRWRGRGGKPMPEKELAHLRDCVQRAHADGRELRFWAMPDRKIVWKTFADAGVDWLNIDKIYKYRRWQKASKQAEK